MRMQQCEYCRQESRIGCSECPHCGRPRWYPNATIATTPEEEAEVHEQFSRAMKLAESTGRSAVAERFFESMSRSNAVITCSIEKLLPLITEQVDVYPAFHYQYALRCSASKDTRNYPVLRANAENILLESVDHQHHVHYGSLTMGELGLASYGDVNLRCDEKMVGHRASIFPFNSALFFEKRKVANVERGLRISWQSRGKGAVVKHINDLKSEMSDDEMESLVVRMGKTREEDVMMEVHILGPITIRTFAGVVYAPKNPDQSLWRSLLRSLGIKMFSSPSPAYSKQLEDYCSQHQVPFELRES